MKLKATTFSKTNRHALKNLSRSTPAMSPSGSPRHSDSDAPIHVSKTNRKFRKKFKLSTEEVIKSYSCAIVSDILLHGTLYITENYFAFYSNILGFINRTVIPIVDVANIQKEKTARFIPNAVGLQTNDGKTYVFSSLISRDTTYKFMVHIWKKSRQLSDGVPDGGSFDDDELEKESNSSYSTGDADMVDGPDAGHESSESSQIITVIPTTITEQNSQGGGTHSNSSPDHSDVQQHGPESLLVENTLSRRPFTPTDNSGKSSQTSVDKVASSTSSQDNSLQQIVSNLVQLGTTPFQAVREGLHEMTNLPQSSVVILASSLLVFLLLASAAFMIYKVEILSQQITYGANDEHSSDLYEEVLQMQQKLHSATAEEVEKTLSLQIKQLATVRQSLDALVFLFNKDPGQLQENS